MKQTAVRFGRQLEMIGILAQPRDPLTAGKRAVLLWNTGISHRVGPQRMNVEISQTLTRLGFPVFRFDLSGRGDSRATDGAMQSAVSDVQMAMDYLSQNYGYEEFILHGLCSGAIEAHYVAATDKRVVGLSMIDTYSYRVGNYYWHYVKKRLLNKASWIKLFSQFRASSGGTQQQLTDQYYVPFPYIESLQTDYRNFVQRKLPCLVTFTGGYDYVFNYPGQFQHMLKGIDLKPILTLNHYPAADHLFTIIEQKERMLDALSQWVMEHFPTP